VKMADACRKAFDEEEIMYPVTHRAMIDCAKTAEMFDLPAGFALSILGKMPACDRKPVSELAQRFLGKRIWSAEPDTGGIEDGVPMGGELVTVDPFCA
jgi:hypothetical protein